MQEDVAVRHTEHESWAARDCGHIIVGIAAMSHVSFHTPKGREIVGETCADSLRHIVELSWHRVAWSAVWRRNIASRVQKLIAHKNVISRCLFLLCRNDGGQK